MIHFICSRDSILTPVTKKDVHISEAFRRLYSALVDPSYTVTSAFAHRVEVISRPRKEILVWWGEADEMRPLYTLAKRWHDETLETTELILRAVGMVPEDHEYLISRIQSTEDVLAAACLYLETGHSFSDCLAAAL